MASRKSNWSKKEDDLLAHKVIQYTQSGKTQLEAFKEVAKETNRTPAACGYRWNAKLRNYYQEELKQAVGDDISNSVVSQSTNKDKESHKETETPLQIALQYLKYLNDCNIHTSESIQKLSELKQENEQLKKKLYYFEQAYTHAFPSVNKD